MNVDGKMIGTLFAHMLLAALLAGCAALTVDVDVYKGPLVDDLDVQIEKTTVMAMGAKPLLIQLRNTLEEEAIAHTVRESADHWDYPEGLHDHNYPFIKRQECLAGRNRIREFQHHDDYWKGFIGDKYQFCGEEAFRVNTVLSLYDDFKHSLYTDPVRRARAALHDFREFEPVLFPIATSKRTEAWRKLQKHMDYSIQREISEKHFNTLRGEWEQSPPGYDDQRSILAAAYREFLSPTERIRWVEHVFVAHKLLTTMHIAPYERWPSITDMLDSEYLFEKDCEEKKGKEKTNGKDCEASITSMFLALAKNKDDIVTHHADLLFPHESEERRLFMAEVERVATSYGRVRNATRGLYRALLSINHLMAMPGEDKVRAQHQQQLVDAIVFLTRGKYLAQALGEDLKTARKKRSLEYAPSYFGRFVASLSKHCTTDSHFCPEYDWTGDKLPTDTAFASHSQTIKKAMHTGLRTDSVRYSDMLLHLDSFFSTTANDSRNVRPTFGITSGCSNEQFRELVLEDILNVVVDIGEVIDLIDSAGGLGGGRLPDGLETQIERYLNHANEYTVDENIKQDEREQLFDSLIRFGETVLFLANNEVLLENGDSNPLREFRTKAVARDTQLLQSVGNSIINQIDEIHHRERYEESIDERGPREALAMKAAFPRYATEAVDDLIEGFEAEVSTTPEQLAERNSAYKTLVDKLEPAQKTLADKKVIQTAKQTALTNATKALTLVSNNSGFLFATEKGKTKDGTIRNIQLLSGLTGMTLADPSLLSGTISPQDRVLSGVYKGGEYDGSGSATPHGYGGNIDDLMIVSGDKTTSGAIIHGKLENARFCDPPNTDPCKLPGKPTLNGTQLTLKELSNFKGKISDANTATLTVSLSGGKANNVTLTDVKHTNGSAAFKSGDQITGKLGGAEISGAVSSCTPTTPGDLTSACKAETDGSHKGISVGNVSLTTQNINRLSIQNPSTLNKVSNLEMTNMEVKDAKISSANKALEVTTSSQTWAATGEVDWKNLSLSVATGKVCVDNGTALCVTSGTVSALKGTGTFAPSGTGMIAKFQATDPGVTLEWKDASTLKLHDGSMTNVWIQGGNTTSGSKKISGPESLVSGATLKPVKTGGTLKPVEIKDSKVVNLHMDKDGNIAGTIVAGTLTGKSAHAINGTASGGTLSPQNPAAPNTIRQATRLDAAPIASAHIGQATLQIAAVGGRTLKIATGARLTKGTIVSATLTSGTIAPAPTATDTDVPDVAVTNANLDNATISQAVVEGPNGQTFEGTITGKLSGLQLTGAKVTGLAAGKIALGTTKVSGTLGTAYIIVSNDDVYVHDGTAKGIALKKVRIPKGHMVGATTHGGETQYDSTISNLLTANKTQRITRTALVTQLIAIPTTSPVPDRTTQLEERKKALEAIKEIETPTVLKDRLPWGNTEICQDQTVKDWKCTPDVLLHTLLQELREDIHTKDEQRRAADTALQTAMREVAEATLQVSAAQAAKDEFYEDYIKGAKAARDTLTYLSPTILKRLARKAQLTSTDAVYDEIVKVLSEQAQDASASASRGTNGGDNGGEIGTGSSGVPDKDAIETTLALVKARPITIRVPSPAEIQGLDAKEVMDQLISTLKYEHIAAVRDGGEGSARAIKFQQTLDLAYRYRASSVLIRPALAYLRSSHPSTALQDNTHLQWKNLLLSNTHRSLPTNSVPWTGDPLPWFDNEREKLKIQSQIDRQFWHNVNRIRINGAGATNYVVMKDDVGNWTVKNYSANPEDIVRSARNLALYGYGAGVGANLISANRLKALDGDGTVGEQLENADGDGNTNENPSLLDRQFEKFTTLYQQETTATVETVATFTDDITEGVKGVWNAAPDVKPLVATTLGGIVDAAHKKHLEPIEPTREKISNKEQEIIKRLTAVTRFHEATVNGIREKTPALTTTPDNSKERAPYTKAIALFTDYIQSQLLTHIAKRQQTVKTYETQATVLHDSVTQQ